MNVRETSHRVWRGEQKVLRLQRRLWLAQLAMWPTLIAAVVVIVLAGMLFWRRESQQGQTSASSEADALPSDARDASERLR